MYSSDSLQTRLYSALAYLLPLASLSFVSAFALSYLQRFAPPLASILGTLLFPFVQLTIIFPFWYLIVFFLLLIAVVQNTSISRFIRFNVLQALLLGFVISVVQMILDVLQLTRTPLGPFLYNLLFVGGFVCVVYGVVESLRGRYTDIPKISEAIQAQVQ